MFEEETLQRRKENILSEGTEIRMKSNDMKQWQERQNVLLVHDRREENVNPVIISLTLHVEMRYTACCHKLDYL